MSRETVSVVIPTYNRKGMLPAALSSVSEQTVPVHEIIVIDDGSEDGSAGMLRKRFPEVKVITQPHRGVSAARNRGLRAATGAWIALLDSDDRWAPDKLARQLKTMASDPRSALCHTNEIWIRDGRRLNPKKKHEKKGGWIFRHGLALCTISPSSVLIKKRIFEILGYFDETLPVCEDYDLWLRICARYPVRYLDEALTIKYGGHVDQLSKQYWGIDRFRVTALDKLLRSGVLEKGDREAACRMLHRKCAILMHGAVKHGNRDLHAACAALLKRHSLDRATPIFVGAS